MRRLATVVVNSAGDCRRASPAYPGTAPGQRLDGGIQPDDVVLASEDGPPVHQQRRLEILLQATNGEPEEIDIEVFVIAPPRRDVVVVGSPSPWPS